MGALDKLEGQLDEVFVKNAPYQLPENAKKWIVQYLPYINLVLGLFALWAAYNLYHWATVANRFIDYANEISRAYGGSAYTSTSRLTIMVWASILTLVVQGGLWVISYPQVKAKKKGGWNLLFIALLVNALYGLVSLFTDYGSIGSLVGYVIGTAIGLYFLFQIRSHYLGKAAKDTAKAPEKPSAKK